ncbi:glycosyltransferase [Streptomyces enissocaesilis]|uniref:Glycosyl transferase family 28 C-terminal domain-containing protein n=1 Tax=Streptomyces enissocaesilis TaxID=332589 RepID=A0ABN3X6R0_9ACTN
MKALLFPWHIGAGHLGRCIEFAKSIERHAGFAALICQNGTATDTAQAPGARAPAARSNNTAKYLVVPDLGAAWSQAGYYNAQRVRRDVRRDAALIDEHRPDVVVTHMQPTAVLAARQHGIPVISIADSDFLDEEDWSWMPWARDSGLRPPPYPDCLPALDTVAGELGLDPVGRPSRLNWGDATFVASAPSVEPAPAPPPGRPHAVHCGPLIWSDKDDRPAAPPTPGRPQLYVSLGSGELWPGQVDELLTSTAQKLDAVVLRTSPDGPAADTPWLRHVGFGTLTSVLETADLVLTHGGHSTLHAALGAGTPALVAPLMSENENNGRVLLEETGAGRCVWHTEVHGSELRFRDTSGNLHETAPLTPEALTDSITAVLSDPSHGTTAQRLAQDLARLGQQQDELITRTVLDLTSGR